MVTSHHCLSELLICPQNASRCCDKCMFVPSENFSNALTTCITIVVACRAAARWCEEIAFEVVLALPSSVTAGWSTQGSCVEIREMCRPWSSTEDGAER